MNTLVELALSNVVMAALLAVPALLAGWWGRRPALTHGLWLLVLLKLVTPPLFRVPIAWPESAPAPEAMAQPADDLVVLLVAPPDVEVVVPPPDAPANAVPAFDGEPAPVAPEAAAQPEVAPAPAPEAVEATPIAWTDWLVLPWLAGGVAWLLVAAWRLERFYRLLRFARPAPAEVQAEAEFLARRMRVRTPQVLSLPGPISPMLWAMGRTPRLLVPAQLLERLRPAQRATLLVHELAHWRRGDHRVRWLEVLTLGVYWWCPLVWWACRQLRQAEEECCDAWVVALLPDCAREYALALVETIDFLSGAPHVLPPAASGAGPVRLLQRRLTMILRGTTPQSLTRAGLLGLAGLGLALLPFVPGLAQSPAPQGGIADDPFVGQPQAQPELAQARREFELALQIGDEAKARQMQAELQAAQQELDRRRHEIEEKLDAIQRALQRAQKQGPGLGGVPPTFFGGGGKSPKVSQAMRNANVEQRLEQVERKLDTLLWEVANLRHDMSRTPKGPPGGPAPPVALPPGAAPGGYRPFPGPPGTGAGRPPSGGPGGPGPGGPGPGGPGPGGGPGSGGSVGPRPGGAGPLPPGAGPGAAPQPSAVPGGGSGIGLSR